MSLLNNFTAAHNCVLVTNEQGSKVISAEPRVIFNLSAKTSQLEKTVHLQNFKPSVHSVFTSMCAVTHLLMSEYRLETIEVHMIIKVVEAPCEYRACNIVMHSIDFQHLHMLGSSITPRGRFCSPKHIQYLAG